jgi:ribosomal protein S18 acetylase RimI-like enzyme
MMRRYDENNTQTIQIKNEKDLFFQAFWEIYEGAFPFCERRSLEEQVCIFANETYCLNAWIKNETILGFIGWWSCEDLRFVEHYAIHPAYRSKGFGSLFLSEWIDQNTTPVLLEIEPALDELSQKRQRFYQKLGFKDNAIKHYQPPYHKGEKSLRLWLMSYPDKISASCYERFYLKQQTEIMPQNTN